MTTAVQATEQERGMLMSLLITISFTFGPVLFSIDYFFPDLFSSELIDPTLVFLTITLLFFLAIIINSFMIWKKMSKE